MSEDILRAAVRAHSETQEGKDSKCHLLRYNCQPIPDKRQTNSPETRDTGGWRSQVFRLRCTK